MPFNKSNRRQHPTTTMCSVRFYRISMMTCMLVILSILLLEYPTTTISMFQHSVSSLSSLPTDGVSVFVPQDVRPPKIDLLSHTLTGDTIDVDTKNPIHLRCVGQKPLNWSFPNNYHPYENFEESANMSITNTCDHNGDDKQQNLELMHWFNHKCISDVIIYQPSYDMTGYFTCHYDTQSSSSSSSPNSMDSIYIFVNDPENLVVPYESAKDYLFIAVFQSDPATIPCRPTYSKAEVTLWKSLSSEPKQIKPNSSLGITYNPKKGFHFEHPRWDSESTFLECRFFVREIPAEAKSTISLHWSILPTELHPIIDDSEAKHIFVNDTFTLRCFVHIDIGVIIVIDWDYPNKNETDHRILKSYPETSRLLVNNNSYDTVSINITVINATREDQGIYRCNATDGHGRIFSATKQIIIFDQLLPATINFTTDFDRTKPIISNYGHDVRFTINAYAYPDISFVELIWYKDGQRLHFNDSNYENHVYTDNQTQITFRIQSAKPSDSGIYSLVGKTTDDSCAISVSVYIQGKPEAIIVNTLDFYTMNRTYELICKSYGYPTTETWWSWMACRTPESCLESDSNNQTTLAARWTNVTTVALEENQAKALTVSNESSPFLNVSKLSVVAQVSGIYQCTSMLWNGFNYIFDREELPFIVMDAEDLFTVTSSTDEPTVNDTIQLICKASIFRYTEIWWTMTRLDEEIHPIYLDELVNKTETDISVLHERNQYSISSTIIFKSVSLNHSSLYTCEAVSRFYGHKTERKDFFLDVQNVLPPFFLESNRSEEIIEAAYNSQMELKCFIGGRPRPTLKWYRNGIPLTFDGHDSGIRLLDQSQRLLFTRLLEQDSGVYECRASNRGGTIARKVLLQVKGDDYYLQTSEILFIIVYSIMGGVIIIAAFFFGKKFRDEKLQKRELEFFSKTLFDQGQMQLFNPEMSLDEQIDLLPYDNRFEFPKERLILGRTLGQGAFGRVVKAEAIGLDNDNDQSVTTVAVKMLKERADTNQRKALMAELKILIHLGKHLNIVNLLGAVTKNLVKGELLVIVEYCEFGNLRHYLLANRGNFVNQLRMANEPQGNQYQNVDIVSGPSNYDSPTKHKEFMWNSGVISYADLLHGPNSANNAINHIDYMNTNGIRESGCQPTVAYYNNNYVVKSQEILFGKSPPTTPTGNQQQSGSKRFSRFQRQTSSGSQGRQGRIVTTTDLICWAFQCARGMDYLTMRKLIHRDLAARNVLLASKNVVKICDFGLAKDVYKYDNYIKKDDGPLPIKWMAIESISDKIFTSKSDVWSYGILLWELFTLGKNPYPGVEIDEEFYKRLKNGYRMEKPEFASEDLYQLMLQCWNSNPNDRPDFAEIADIVGELLDDRTKKHYIELNNPYLEMNQQILGTQDYLKMTACTTDERLTNPMILAPEESEYETNIPFIAASGLDAPPATSAAAADDQRSKNGTLNANIIEMSILERSLEQQTTAIEPLNGQTNDNVNNIHYDNLNGNI